MHPSLPCVCYTVVVQPSRAKTAKRAVIRARATADILDLRAQGMSIRQIQAELSERYQREYGRGIARSTVHKYLQQALEEANRANIETIEQQRTLRSIQLGKLLQVHYPRALEGSLPHTDRVLRILDQLNRLYGLYAPVQHEVRSNSLDALLAPLLEQLGGDDGAGSAEPS